MTRDPPDPPPRERRRDTVPATSTPDTAPEGTLSAIVAAPSSFEIVNAAFGRSAGDRLVQMMSDRLDAALQSTGARIARAGATFSVLLPGDSARAVATLVERTLEEPFSIGGESVRVGVRIGIAHRNADETEDHLVQRAVEALARARASDGATTHVAAGGDGTLLAELAADLHRAIDRGEIDVLFQPQVSIDDGRIEGVEALARWAHPRRGALGAETLLAAAERAGLGVALSEHVQQLALVRAARWPAALGRLRIALNVTAADIARDDFAAAAAVAPERVTAEVTESGVIGDLPRAAAALATLRAAGCRVALDDFGTGYSSLAYLSRLPLDYLKIDRTLTQAIDGDARERTVIDGIFTIATGLGLATIAEGVETASQRALLAARGCTISQGFLCAMPHDDEALIALVEGDERC